MIKPLQVSGLRRTTFVWITAFACLTRLPLFGATVRTLLPALILVVNAALLVCISFIFRPLIRQPTGKILQIYFSAALIVALFSPTL